MIYLRTGQPGAGKTLLTLADVRARAEKEGRPVFYAGIEILKPEMFPGWQELPDPKRWMDCPDGAIIVHDECQTLYRPRGNGATVPDYVARFETHRHNGWDIYLITQHPMLVDSNIRRLAGEHMHVVRAFGSKMATVHKWGQVKEQCDKIRADSVSETRAYPKELFDAYKSATVHTHKASIPGRIWFLALLPVLLGLLAWWFYGWYQDQSAGPKVAEQAAAQSAQQAAPRPANRVLTKAEWMEARAPRIEGLPHTAPVYDEVTKPTRAPRPAACVQWPDKGCRCFTQQGTRIDTPADLCASIVQRGYFMEWDEEGRQEGKSDRRDPPAATIAFANENP